MAAGHRHSSAWRIGFADSHASVGRIGFADSPRPKNMPYLPKNSFLVIYACVKGLNF